MKSFIISLIAVMFLIGCTASPQQIKVPDTPKISDKNIEIPEEHKPLPADEKKPDTIADGQRTAKELITLDLTGIKLGSIMAKVAENEKVVILCDDSRIIELVPDSEHLVFHVPDNEINSTIRMVFEVIIEARGYKIIRDGFIWSIARSDLAAELETEKALLESTSSSLPEDNSGERFTFSFTGVKVGSLLALIAELKKIVFICEDYGAKDGTFNVTPPLFDVPLDIVDTIQNDLTMTTLRNRGYVIIKNGDVWCIVKKKNADRYRNKLGRTTVTPQTIKEGSEQVEVSYSGVKFESMLRLFSEWKNIPVIYENGFNKNRTIDCIPIRFSVSVEKLQNMQDTIFESNLILSGYEIVKEDLLWKIVKLRQSNESISSDQNEEDIQAAENDDAKVTINFNEPKIGSLLLIVSERNNITVAYENDSIRDISSNIILSSFDTPNANYDAMLNRVIESVLEMNGYEIIKKDKVWTVVMNKIASQAKAAKDAQKWHKTGCELSNRGEYNDALKAFEQGIKCDPQNVKIDVWLDYGNAFYYLGKYDEAFRAYNKAIEIDPQNPDGWYNRAFIYSLKKDKTNTLSDLAKALGLNYKYKEHAKKDTDFQWLWEDGDFKKLTQ